MAFSDETALLDALCEPSPALVEQVAQLESPLVVVGAGGKMGPTLCVMAKRAAQEANRRLDVIALSRFSNPAESAWLAEHEVETRRYDALDENAAVALPDAAQVVYLVGLKFGTQSNPGLTWATNTLAPAQVVRRYAGGQVVALSTGNVYPLVPADSAGAAESAPLTPLGEYANAAVARERVIEYVAERHHVRGALIRLNYALDCRYGVLVDLGQKILSGTPIELTMGRVNCIWQRDANERILRAFSLVASPVAAYNLSSPVSYAVEDLARELGKRLSREPQFVGHPAPTALLTDATRLADLMGKPETSLDSVLDWTADWLLRGGRVYGKPTKFDVRDGTY